MRSMAADYARNGIRVNAIVPGTMDTPMNAEEFSDPEARNKYIPRIPAGRLGVGGRLGRDGDFPGHRRGQLLHRWSLHGGWRRRPGLAPAVFT